MSFTNAPALATYSSKRVQIAWPKLVPESNNNTYPGSNVSTYQAQGPGMVNVLLCKEGEEVVGKTRPALSGVLFEGGDVSSPPDQGIVRGLYAWDTGTSQYSFVVVGTSVYTTDMAYLSPSSWSKVGTLTSSDTTPVRFTEFITDTGTKKLILSSGTELWSISTGLVVTKVTDADMPVPHLPFPIFLNGRVFLAKEGSGDIYQSALNDPTTWTAGDFISTEVFPDDIQALVKVDNYILAIGIQGSEYFYDAANATGSILARMEGQVLPFGTLFPNSIACSKDTVVMLASTNDGQSVFKTINGFSHVDLPSTGIIDDYYQHLKNPYAGYSSYATAATSCRGNFFRHDGKLHYSFLTDGTRGGEYGIPAIDPCYVFSFETKSWGELQFGEDLDRNGQRWGFPIYFTCEGLVGSMTTYVAGNAGVSAYAFFAELRPDRGYDDLNSTVVSPISKKIYQELVTPQLDFDTLNQKYMSRLGVVADCGDATSLGNLKISWNDYNYDYSKWTTYVEIPSGSSFDYPYPYIYQLGKFRRRAFKFVSCEDGKARTWRFFEVMINKGMT